MSAQQSVAYSKIEPIRVLSISSLKEDHSSLQSILRHSSWQLLTADDLLSAFDLLRDGSISVVLCEHSLTDGSWKDLLRNMESIPHRPALIVTSRLADDHLWAEALNLGAHDVLAKPYHRNEVVRSIKLAWDHWHEKRQTAAWPLRLAAAS